MRSHGPDRPSIVASVVTHIAILAGVWWLQSQAPDQVEFETFQIEVVTLAQLEPTPETATPEVPVETIDPPEPEPIQEELPPPPEPEPEPEPPPPEPEPEPEPEPPPPEPEPEPEPEPQRETPPTPPDAEVAEETTPEDIRVRMEGLRRDFPVYYENIIRQINRCFRWRGAGNWVAVVQFEIQADGTVPARTIRVAQPSGNVSFDIEAEGAVECAGGEGRFGPLPPELPWDALPIRFTFSPGGEQDLQF